LGGLSPLASEMEIKQAYKKWALVLHPDKASSEEDRKLKEEQFKKLGQALETLGNKESRELYDEGYDLQGIKDELERRKRRHH
jgi:DnaJ-class molecular chaperone